MPQMDTCIPYLHVLPVVFLQVNSVIDSLTSDENVVNTSYIHAMKSQKQNRCSCLQCASRSGIMAHSHTQQGKYALHTSAYCASRTAILGEMSRCMYR